MSAVLDLFQHERLLAGAAMVVAAICVTTAASLLISRFFARRPTVRHAVLAAALVCSLVTPLIAVLIRTCGISTFDCNLLAQEGQGTQQPVIASSKPSITRSLSSSIENEQWADGVQPSFDPNSAGTMLTTDLGEMLAESESPTPMVAAADWRGVIRHGVSVATIVWLAGSALILLRVVCGSIGVYRIRRSGRPFLADSRGTIASHLQKCLRTKHLPAILISDAIQSPAATGVFQGAVILPAGLVSNISTGELCDVLMHECAHVLRRDPMMLYLRMAALCLFWPIPLVHWLNRELSDACEEICDNYVLARRTPLRYAETLLQIATIVGRTRRSAGFVGILHWRGKLESRIVGLIDEKRNRSIRGDGFRSAMCLIAFLSASVVICGTTIRAERTEQAAPQVEAQAQAAPQAVASIQAEASAAPQPTSTAVDPASTAGEAKPAVAAKPAQPLQIQIWWGLGGEFGAKFEKLVKRFNESQDRVSVNVRTFGGYGAVRKELDKAFRRGELPDAAVIEIHSVASFAVDHRIQPLDDMIKNDPTFQPEDLLPGILSNLRYQDRLYAIPMNRSTPILYFNKDRFKEAGLDPEKPPATWQELREMSVALTSDDRSKYGFVAVNSPWFFESMVWSNGGELVVDGKPTFAQFGAGPLQLWADMVHLDHTARFNTGGFGEFSSGRAAMAVDSTALLQAIASQVHFNLGTALLPRTEGFPNAVPTGGGAAVIPAKNSPERQAAAWAFVSWFTKTQQTADWSEATGYIPIRESARTLLRTDGFYQKHPQFEVAINQMAYAREAPQLPQWSAVWKILEGSMTTVVRDDAPAMRTLKDAEKKVESVLTTAVETPES